MRLKPKGFDDYWIFDKYSMSYNLKDNAPEWAVKEYEEFYREYD